MEPQRKLLTLNEVARELRCSKATEGRVRHASRLPSVRLGRRKLVRREALDVWIRENESGGRDTLLTSEIDAVRRIQGGT